MGSVSFSIVMTLSLLGVVLLVVFRAVAKVCRFVIMTDWISSSITFDDSPSIDGRLADAFHERLVMRGSGILRQDRDAIYMGNVRC